MTNAVPEILTLTHGGWGAHLIECLKMITGELPGVADLALMPVDTFAEFYAKVRAKVAVMPAGSLIITDFHGGSTSNVAARISADFDIGVVTGLNATLLLAALELREAGRLADQVDDLVETGRGSVKDIVKGLKQQ